MDLCEGGDLYDRIEDPNDLNTEEDVRKIFIQLIKAVKYCHANGISHRDIKAENVIF